ncbi:MAG TPA: DUF6011 domain-containing protein [Noviherbaspirillum sp.]|nr:DUF6011 domain-containing protein [Noviherbaspirillum sp.]
MQATTCSCCGKPLTDPVSVEIGMGPVCRISNKEKEVQNKNGNLFANRASYDFTIEQGIVCVVDLDNGRSVTNDAENVIADLAAKGIDLDTHLVIYRDTLGVWDQLQVSNLRFAGFKSLNERDKELAKLKVRT